MFLGPIEPQSIETEIVDFGVQAAPIGPKSLVRRKGATPVTFLDGWVFRPEPLDRKPRSLALETLVWDRRIYTYTPVRAFFRLGSVLLEASLAQLVYVYKFRPP